MLQEHLDVINSIKEKFVYQRTRQEAQVEAWAKSIMRIKDTVLGDIKFPEEISLRGFVPELYKEHPNKEVYLEQFQFMQLVFVEVNKRVAAYNAEADKILQNFVTVRARQEIAVSEWADKIRKVDPGVLGDLQLPEELTLKAMVPELYVAEPNKEIYLEQLKKAQALFDKVNEIVNKYNEEATVCLSEYQALSSAMF